MKHSLHTRILALVMAIAIVLSTGVLNSAGWLLASGGEQEETSVVEPTESQPQQGDIVVQPVTIPSSEPDESGSDPSESSSAPAEETSAPAGETLTVVIPPELLEQVPESRREALRGVLAQDPRPHYQNDPDRVYGFTFAGMEVRFSVAGGVLAVREIIPQ